MNSKQLEDATRNPLKDQVDYSLDFLADQLIRNGRIPPSKSYVVKSPEMRAQMEKQLIDLNRRKNYIQDSEIGNKKVTFKPASTPIAFTATLAPKETTLRTGSPNSSKFTQNTKTKVQNSYKGTPKASASIRNRTPPNTSKAPLKLSHSKTMQITTLHHKQDSSKNPLKVIKPVSTVSAASKIKEAFWTRVDMKGFGDDEIALDVSSHHVTVTGYRVRRGMQNSRKVTEVIEIPSHIQMETLRIGRRADGALIIEENVEN